MDLKTIDKHLLIVGALILIIISAFGISIYKSGQHVSDKSAGASRVTANIQETETNIRGAADKLEDVGAGITSAQSGINAVQGRLDQSTDTIDRILESGRGSESLARESISLSERAGDILRGVSERNAKANN